MPGNLLYPLAGTGPVVPAHPGDDQEQMEVEREYLEDALCTALSALLVLSIRVIASRSFWSRPWRDGHPAKANWPLDPALHSLRGLSLSVITASSSL